MNTLLAVFPHPDDETWAAGATLALAGRAGLSTHLLCLTDAEEGWDRTHSLVDPVELGAQRRSEQQLATKHLGISNVVYGGMPHRRLAENQDEARTLIRAELDRLEPDIVVSFSCDGVYGHVDHVATWELLRSELGTSDDEEQETLWLSVGAKSASVETLWRSLHRLKTTTPLVVDDYPSRRASFNMQRTIQVDITPVREQKLNALGAYTSQLRNGDPLSFIRPNVIEPLLQHEYISFEAGASANFGAFVRHILAPQS